MVNAPSFGVGMELERAVARRTPVLCLRSAGSLDGLSYMVRGVLPDESPNFYVVEYKSIDDARKSITEFLRTT